MTNGQKKCEVNALCDIQTAMGAVFAALRHSRCNLALAATLDAMAALKRAEMALCDAIEAYEVAADLKSATAAVED